MVPKKLEELLLKAEKRKPEFLVTLWGKFDHESVSTTLKEIENKCVSKSFTPSLETRLKTISVEILQNIGKHGSSSDQTPPYFLLCSTTSEIVIYSGNTINLRSKDVVNERLLVYSGLNSQELKKFYRHSLGHTSISESGNAGIGLLDIVYRSGQQVKWTFEEQAAGFSYFEMQVRVEKQSSLKN